ncbi:MAG: sensor histidine kinase [Clostridiaceae bacterium]
MQSIRRRLAIILTTCSLIAIFLTAFLVNYTVNKKFDEYLKNLQSKRDNRIVDYFAQVYSQDKQWSKSSGLEITHEALMNEYCIILYDKNKEVVWGMDPKDIYQNDHFKNMYSSNQGIYIHNTLDIEVDNEVVGYVEIGQYSPIVLSKDDIEFKNSLNKSIVYGGIITFIVIIILSLIISKQFTTPIEEVSKIADNLTKGKYKLTSNIKSKIIELNTLQTSINSLSEKLSYQEELRRRLVSDVSHEIRTPLNILQNNIEAMIDKVFPVTDERLVSLNDEVIRFGKLLDDLNILKEFETEEVNLLKEEISISRIIEGLYNDFKYVADEKKLTVKLNKKTEEDIIYGDKFKLKQVFINFISNSIKFSKERGEILIDISSDLNSVIVKITDNGIGIEKKNIPFIFERLYKGDIDINKEGKGIGLTIVKRILELHDAEIKVFSERNKGTSFVIIFNKVK